jgi:hypothetical protein
MIMKLVKQSRCLLCDSREARAFSEKSVIGLVINRRRISGSTETCYISKTLTETLVAVQHNDFRTFTSFGEVYHRLIFTNKVYGFSTLKTSGGVPSSIDQ